MRADDWFVPSFRELGGWLMRGMPLEGTFLYHNGFEEGNVMPDAPRTLPLAVIVASQTLHAVGLAYAMQYRGEDAAVVSFFGDGATSQGDFAEALNFAGVWQAPVVFVCQNNQWAISVPAHRQTASETFAQKGDAYGVPNERVDGNDIFAVYETCKEAVDRARAGEGPTFVECVTYRIVEHNTADEPSVYRDEEQREYWLERDPVDRFETYLLSEGVIDEGDIEGIEAELEELVDAAVASARTVPDSAPEEMFANHLRGESWNERHQRAELQRELDGKNPFTDWTGEGFQ
jgi:TPP-dependent pyruvate/acetoin dehydrogenase alpha subunit